MVLYAASFSSVSADSETRDTVLLHAGQCRAHLYRLRPRRVPTPLLCLVGEGANYRVIRSLKLVREVTLQVTSPNGGTQALHLNLKLRPGNAAE